MPLYDVALYQGSTVEIEMPDVQADSPEEAAEVAIERAMDEFRERLSLEVWPADSPVLSKAVYVVN